MGDLEDLAKAVEGNNDWPEIIDDAPTGGDCLIGPSRTDPARQAMMAQIAGGFMPRLDGYAGVAMLPMEVPHLAFDQTRLYQRRLVDQEYVQNYQGLTFYDHGLALSAGTSRGHIVNHFKDVCLGEGRLLITSKRMIFSSPTTAFSEVWSNVLSATWLAHGVSIVLNGSDPFLLSHWDAELMALAVRVCGRLR
ncbi:MAG: hypothetical protein JWN24_397 [Phycisphaerales bacterium]|nr:hypothetical protein [Phycisphaerales bacterium]